MSEGEPNSGSKLVSVCGDAERGATKQLRDGHESTDPGTQMFHSTREVKEPLAYIPYVGFRALISEKLEKAATVDFKKHPAQKAGTRSRAVSSQGLPNVCFSP